MKKFRRFSSSFFDAFLQKSRKNAVNRCRNFVEKLWDNNEVGRRIKWQRTNVDLRKPVTERKEI